MNEILYYSDGVIEMLQKARERNVSLSVVIAELIKAKKLIAQNKNITPKEEEA